MKKKLRFLLSLTNDDNDYQIEQASAARQAAGKLGVELQIVYAGNDGIVQSQQLLSSIHSANAPRPDAILFEPAGSTAHPQVARAAADAGIGVVLLNSNADYISELRRRSHVPAFAITSNHEEIGRIQGQQLGAVLPAGGIVLYIQGPSESLAAKQRYTGLLETKSDGVQLRVLRAHGTEASAYNFSGFPLRARRRWKQSARGTIPWPWEPAKPSKNAANCASSGRRCRFSVATDFPRPGKSGCAASC